MTSAATKKRKPHATTARPETLTDQAYNRLEEMIVTLELAPGAVLSEQALSADLGIGRTPIREALQRLALEGLVLVLPRKAIIVTDTDPQEAAAGAGGAARAGAAAGARRRGARLAETERRSFAGHRRRHGGGGAAATTTSPSCASTAS